MSAAFCVLPNLVHDHRIGRIRATAGVVARVPKPALVRASRAHANTARVFGDPVETRHSYDGTLFRIRTDGPRKNTRVWLEVER
jgi:hypothetical protein